MILAVGLFFGSVVIAWAIIAGRRAENEHRQTMVAELRTEMRCDRDAMHTAIAALHEKINSMAIDLLREMGNIKRRGAQHD